MLRLSLVLALSVTACTSKDERLSAFDDDEDGFLTELSQLHGGEPPWDCDDEHAEAFPGGTEVCDGLDNDCNGTTDDGDDRLTLYADTDGDGFGDPATEHLGCAADDTNVTDATDCDDGNKTVSPVGSESCNGLDDDCDGTTDNDDASDATEWWMDNDEDGVGDDTLTTTACDAPDGYVGPGDIDCDDDEPLAAPDLTEVCQDGIDNDCSGDGAGCEWPAEQTEADANVVLVGASDDVQFGRVIAVGDLTGDGIDDLVVASKVPGGRIYVWTGGTGWSGGPPAATFTGPTSKTEPSDLALGDVTGDGKADLVTAWWTPTSSDSPVVTIRVGPVTPSSPEITLTAVAHLDEIIRVVIGDFAGDASNDLVVRFGLSVTTVVGPFSTNGTLTEAGGPAAQCGGSVALDLAWASGPELACSKATGGLSLFHKPLDGPDVLNLTGFLSFGPYNPSAADIDADGKNELFVVDPDGSGTLYGFDGSTLPSGGALPLTDATFRVDGTSPTRPLGSVKGVARFDDDVLADVVIASKASTDGTSDLWVVSGAGLIDGVSLGDPLTWHIALRGGVASLPAYDVATGDLNDDTHTDVFVAQPEVGPKGTVRAFLGTSP